MNKKIKTLTKMFMGAAIVSMGISSVHARLIDLRIGAGLSAVDPSGFEDRVRTVSGNDLTADTFDTYNADIIFRFASFPMTLGVRYEEANQNKTASTSEWELDVNNLALLVDWRMINSAFYLGPIVSIGYPWADLDFTNNGTRESHRLDSDQLSYSGGLEAGVYFGPFLVGAETGYKSIRLKGSSSSGSSVDTNVVLEGFYGKAMVGLTFF
jgi:hypothetical protein